MIDRADTPAGTAPTDEESRAAMRAFLQRAEVRLSTVHRVAQALLGGSALVLLLPLFIRDSFPRMATLLIAGSDAGQSWFVLIGIGVAATVSLALPVLAIFLLVGDLLGFYFTSNTFGASGGTGRTVFNPRFIVPGLGFNDDELTPATARQLDAQRRDVWTRALLVPTNPDDDGWRARFDQRTRDVWGTDLDPGPDGDDARLRQSFRLAGLHSDRTLAHDVARTEALLARHVLVIRIVVLRYTKALLLLITTTVASLAASGLIEHAAHRDPAGGAFVGGVPYRSLALVAAVYVVWAPSAVRAVTAPLRMIQRHTPGVGEHRDVYRDGLLTQFESATVFATGLVLAGACAALVVSAHRAGGGTGAAVGALLAVGGVAAWLAALRGYAAGWRQTLWAVRLIARGAEAPRVPRPR